MKDRQRAVRGTIGNKLLLCLPDDLRAAANKAAKREGITVTEWIRNAIRKCLIP